MTVYHLSAPDKAALVAQIEEIADAATEAGQSWRVQMQPSVGSLYTAVVTVEDTDA